MKHGRFSRRYIISLRRASRRRTCAPPEPCSNPWEPAPHPKPTEILCAVGLLNPQARVAQIPMIAVGQLQLPAVMATGGRIGPWQTFCTARQQLGLWAFAHSGIFSLRRNHENSV